MQIKMGGAVQMEPDLRRFADIRETNLRLPNQAQTVASTIEIPAAQKLNASYCPGSIKGALNATHRHRTVIRDHNHVIRINYRP
jgi:hypothetical protein